MELARRNNRAVLLVELRGALVNVLTAAGITARTVAHQFRHTRRGPRGPKRRIGGIYTSSSTVAEATDLYTFAFKDGRSHRFLNRDYIMFDCGSMAFSEANLKPFVRVCSSLHGEPHPYSAFWRFRSHC